MESSETTTKTRKPRTTKVKEQIKMAKKTFNAAKASEAVTFAIDDDEFEAIPATSLPAGVLAQYFQDINEGKLFDAHSGFFKEVLTEDSYKVFSDRLTSKEKPITVTLLGEIASWLLGDVYMGGNTEESKP